jgi:D-alanyl-D-alanine carboxypeptidase
LAKLESMERSIPNHAVGRGNDPTCGESDAVFPWWSITKTVLAAAVLRLVDSGRLSLGNLYRDRPYTIRQLLQHTAGLNTYGGPPYRAAVAAGDPVWPVAELLARVKADRLVFSPGEGWAYSNVGYLFVRQLIEETVGMEIDESLRALVFDQWAFSARGSPRRPTTWRRLTGAIQMATIRGGFIMAS